MSTFYLPIFFILLALSLALLYFYKRFRYCHSRLKEALHRIAETNNFMSLFSENLTSEHGLDNSMNKVASYVADIIGAQSICIFKLKDDELNIVASIGAFPLTTTNQHYKYVRPRYIKDFAVRDVFKVGEGLIGEVAETKESLFSKYALTDDNIPNNGIVPIDSLMAVPLIYEGNVTGVICAINNRRKNKTFSNYQFKRFKFMASQVVLAQNFVHAYSSLAEQQRINQELNFARQLQASLLPRSFPAWGDYIINSFTRSAKEVSGDFFDFVEVDSNRLLIVVGDACGKGVPACMIMAMTRAFIRSNVPRFTTLKDMLTELNTNLYNDIDDERFITLACCLIDKKESTVEYARAGHTPMFMFIRNHIREFNPKGVALGMLPTELVSVDTVSFEFTPGSSLFLFTDGINEQTDINDEEYGIERLRENYEIFSKQGLTSKSVIGKILTSIDDFTKDPNISQADDQTMVIIRSPLK
jgi:sigma-B regulation protein RsbU (phosphoserine phosphatase)